MHVLGRTKLRASRIVSRVRRRAVIRGCLHVSLLMVVFWCGMMAHNWLLFGRFSGIPNRDLLCRTPSSSTSSFLTTSNSSIPAIFALPPPEPLPYRLPDTLDTFSTYAHRHHPNCNMSSQHLHHPFSPVCTTRSALLTAFSSGGRIGIDAPFIPLSCDMRWFTTQEACAILSRFEKVIVVGDSMMRHVVGALNVILREDLGYGAVTGWNFNEEEREECFCARQMDVRGCSVQGVYRSSDVRMHDPGSIKCKGGQKVDVVIELMLRFPLDGIEVARFQELLDGQKPKRPYAFVYGHGLWNDLDLQATVNWVDGVNRAAVEKARYLGEEGGLWPRLMVTPNAAGIRKPDQWLLSQGDKAIRIFELAVKEQVEKRAMEHLGTWNMSVQSETYDGVHLDLRGNLIKAMGVLNWLAMVDVEEW